jgi:hypothetical protein
LVFGLGSEATYSPAGQGCRKPPNSIPVVGGSWRFPATLACGLGRARLAGGWLHGGGGMTTCALAVTGWGPLAGLPLPRNRGAGRGRRGTFGLATMWASFPLLLVLHRHPSALTS